MRLSADDVRIAYPLFQTESGGVKPTSAFQLHFGPIDWKRYQSLNELWHSRLPKITNAQSHRMCYAAEYDGIFYAVAGWSNPLARMLPQQEWLELRRMAIADDAPKNTASRFLAWMIRDIRKRFCDVEKLISYQDTAVHKGTIYSASGWINIGVTNKDGSWDRPNRSRVVAQAMSPKIRWEKDLICPST